jgi:hypothetical protein
VAAVAHNIQAASATQAFANADMYEPKSKQTHQHNLRLSRPKPVFQDEDDFDRDMRGQKHSSAQQAGGAGASATNNGTSFRADAAAVESRKETSSGSEKRASDTNAGGEAHARTKQHTQDKGKQKKCSDAACTGDDTQLAEMWEKTQAKFNGRKYGTLQEAVDDMYTKTCIHKTIVQRSAFVESRSEYQEFGLFVRSRYRVNIADIVGILCSNQNSSDKEPSGQMSYLMPGNQYCKFENSDQLHMHGSYANTCMDPGDPPINAIFKHVRLSIANTMVTLVVLVALKPIASNQEIFVDYGNIFCKTRNRA